MTRKAAGPIALLLLAVAWLALQAPELINLAVFHWRSQTPGAGWRLCLSLVPLLGSLGFLAGSEKVSPVWRGRLLLGAVVCLGLRGLHLVFNSLDPDEPVHLHIAWQLGQGLIPYVDFMTVRHMLLHGLWSPLMVVMEGNLSVIPLTKFLFWCLMGGTVWLLGLIAKELGADPWAAAILVLCLPNFVWASVEFRADPPANFLALLALLFLLRGRPEGAGASVGTAFLMIQKAGVHGVCLGLGGLLAGRSVRFLLRLTGVALAVASLHFLIPYSLGFGSDYLRCCYLYPNAFLGGRGIEKNPAWLVFWLTTKNFPLHFLAGVVGFGICLKPGSNPGRRQLAGTALTAALSLYLMGVAWKNWTLFATCCLTLVAALGWTTLVGRDQKGLAASVPTVVLLMMASMSLFHWAAQPPQGLDLSGPQAALERTAPDQTYHGEDNLGNLYNPLFRHNASYFGITQSAYDLMVRRAEPERRFLPLDLEPLVASPPKTMVIEKQQRLQEILRAMERAGVAYERYDQHLWVRRDRGSSNSPSDSR